MSARQKKKLEVYVVDKQTEEVLSKDVINEGDKIKYLRQKDLTEQQLLYVKNKKDIQELTRDLGGFYMLYYSDKLFDGKVSDKNIAKIIYLATFLEYGTNRLIDSQPGRPTRPLLEEDIKYELGLKNKTSYKEFMQEMTENGIIILQDGYVYLSPFYFNKGTDELPQDYFGKIYVNTVRQLYKQVNTRQHKSLGYLFQLLPFIDYNYCVITAEPNTENALNYKLTKKDIAGLLGLNLEQYKKVEQQLLQMTFMFRENVYSVIGSVSIKTNKKQQFYVVNPLIFNNCNSYDNMSNLWLQLLRV